MAEGLSGDLPAMRACPLLTPQEPSEREVAIRIVRPATEPASPFRGKGIARPEQPREPKQS